MFRLPPLAPVSGLDLAEDERETAVACGRVLILKEVTAQMLSE